MTRWLQWSTADLANGPGGVEVHARMLQRELRALGMECELSRDPRDAERPEWDVVVTHGSTVTYQAMLPALLKRRSQAVRVFTLHGTALGRMRACGEWAWLGGYAAAGREWASLLASDVVVTVNANLDLFRFAERNGQVTAFSSNGWDAAPSIEGLPARVDAALGDQKSAWAFIGRGDDSVKGASNIVSALKFLDSSGSPAKLIAVPGSGFSTAPDGLVFATDKLSPGQVKALLARVRGLLLPSYYEGNSLAMLEALTSGIAVVATRVGAVPWLEGRVQGLIVCRSPSAEDLVFAIRQADGMAQDDASRSARALANQKMLPTWKRVAQTYVDAVQRFKLR